MFKRLSIFLGSILLSINFINYTAFADASAPVPSADGAVLMNGVTGEILYSKNPDGAYPPASTTKILTTLLTLENCNLDDIVTVGANPPNADGSSIALLPGEQASVRDILYGLNLQSGNDCAEALAEHIAGTQEKFAEMMNKRAKELGCKDSNFVNPSGLYDKNHKTSARDLAIILRELVKYPEYTKIASTLTYVMEANNKSTEKRYIWNKNKLVTPSSNYYYRGALAGKTGYTIESKHSYVAAAERDGQLLIVTLVHDSTTDSYNDTIRLLDYGFNNFHTKGLFNKYDKIGDFAFEDGSSIPLLASNNFFYSLKKGDDKSPTINLKIDAANMNKSSVTTGDKIGTADILKDGNIIGSVDLLCGRDHLVKAKAVPTLAVAAHYNSPGSSRYIFLASAAIIVLLIGLGLFKGRLLRLVQGILYKIKESR